MDASEAGTLLRRWFASERLEVREQQDPRAEVHLAVKYPPGPRGHTFTVVVPKGRDLVAVSSVTRVDAGQQDEMSALMGEDEEEWKGWVHEMRMHLITSGVDWNLSMGHDGKSRPGPLQAFNVSLPIWFDGLTKNELMQALRSLWMSKLGLIHEIKFGFGQGVGRPGPVDDWEERSVSVVKAEAAQAPWKRRRKSKSSTTTPRRSATISIHQSGFEPPLVI